VNWLIAHILYFVHFEDGLGNRMSVKDILELLDELENED
jgi:hypothetical protein